MENLLFPNLEGGDCVWARQLSPRHMACVWRVLPLGGVDLRVYVAFVECPPLNRPTLFLQIAATRRLAVAAINRWWNAHVQTAIDMAKGCQWRGGSQS